MNRHIISGSFRRATTRLVLLPLACGAALTVGLNWAAATDQVPYKDAYELRQVSYYNNGDGTSEQVYAGQGIATHAGRITTVLQVHVGVTQYDPFSNSFIIEFSGTEILTAANGDTLLSTITGAEFLPLDSDFNVLPPPFHIEATQQITGGTGRFKGATGSLTVSAWDHNDGNISVTSKGDHFFGRLE